MTVRAPERFTIETGKSGAVSALLLRAEAPRACFVFAHGAGAGMAHSFMEAFAIGLSERGLASLRYQFLTWKKAASGRTRRRLRRPRCVRRWQRPRRYFQALL